MLVVACMDVGTRAMQEHIVGPSFFKGVTINAKMRLAHELLSSPEPHILKWFGYKLNCAAKRRLVPSPIVTFESPQTAKYSASNKFSTLNLKVAT
ncbi:hypothetical protein [Pseudoalteromonas sp. NBT06-2]|uniref:hypothetical protein n=1 Tax=Pseudoalteromonas sp. NBT06-2 TaxID=2025950 RepID=UPI0014835C6F|nr:hypothetical protein [Pseudoalteromonas sp. NBT06-2]